MDSTEVDKLIGELEIALDRLRSLYEQYFMGIERIEPGVARKDVDRRIHSLRKEQIRNTALRFRFQMVLQRYNTYQPHWQRICREIENGTYKRQASRARRRLGSDAPRARMESSRPPPPVLRPGDPLPPDLAAELAELDKEFAPAPTRLPNANEPRPIAAAPRPLDQAAELAELDTEFAPAPARLPNSHEPRPIAAAPRPPPQAPSAARAQAVPPTNPPLGAARNVARPPPPMHPRAPGAPLPAAGGPALRAQAPSLTGEAAASRAAASSPASPGRPPGLPIPVPPAPLPPAPRAWTAETGSAPVNHAALHAPGSSRSGMVAGPVAHPPAPAGPAASPGLSARAPAPSALSATMPDSAPRVAASAGAATAVTRGAPVPAPAAAAAPPGAGAGAPARAGAHQTSPLPTAAVAPSARSSSSTVGPPVAPRPAPPAAQSPAPRAVAQAGASTSGAVLHADARSPTAPSPPAPPRGASSHPQADDLTEDRVRQIYSQYMETRRRQNESTAMPFDSVAKNLRESSARLRQKHGKPVDFEVMIKDGKAFLRPILK